MQYENFAVMRGQQFESFVQGFGVQRDLAIQFGRFAAGLSEKVNCLLVANFVADKSRRFVMGDAIEPGAKSLGNLQGLQTAKSVEPNFLMKVESVIRIGNETT